MLYKYDVIFKYSKNRSDLVFIRVKCNLFKTRLASYETKRRDDQQQNG